MKQRVIAIIAFCLLASAAISDEFNVEKTYSFHHQDFLKKDVACISAFADKVVPEFRGLAGLRLAGPTITDTSSGALATYPNATFLSAYGDVQGTISCVFSKTREKPTDISSTRLSVSRKFSATS